MIEGNQAKSFASLRIPEWLGVALVAAIVGIFFFLVPGFGPSESLSPLAWLRSAWSPEIDMEHGYLIPVIMVGLLFWQRKAFKLAVDSVTFKGFPVVVVGAVLFFIAHRSGQPRVAVAALPVILWGAVWFLWGWKVARLSFFPLFLLVLAIPYPRFYQSSVHLGILSNKLAQIGAACCGVDVELRGARILSTDGSFDPLEIDRGCGGDATLLILIAMGLVWAYVSNLAFWKKCLLVLLVVPIGVFSSALRLSSIFVIAKYGDPDFARGTWHDWSGLLLLYPTAVLLLFAVFCLLNGKRPRLGYPWTRGGEDGIPENRRPVISIKSRSIFLSCFLGIILSAVLVLPAIVVTRSAMSAEIPSNLGDWVVRADPPSDKELGIILRDTEFAKATCFLRREEERSYITGEAPMDRADISIMISGRNLSPAIYRPERTLSAQGYRDQRLSSSEITLGNGRAIAAKRVLSKLDINESSTIDSICYYVFVGHSDVTSSHFRRTLVDLKDLVFKAEAQEWATIVVSMRYEDQIDRAIGDPSNLEMAEEKLRNLLEELMENNVDWSLIGN